MQIVYEYSHLNGLEYMQVHRSALLNEIRQVIAQVDAEGWGTKE